MSDASFCWWCGSPLKEAFAVVRDRRVHKVCFEITVDFFRQITAQPSDPCPPVLAEELPW